MRNSYLLLFALAIFLCIRTPDPTPDKPLFPDKEYETNSIDASMNFGKLYSILEEYHYNSYNVVRSKGYTFERHKVLTDDGYWLSLFRIGKGNTRSKRVVFLQHGVVDSADTFIMNDEDKAPGFMFVNQGFDVWLGNTRGNKHSREHRWLDPDDAEDARIFFDYSFEEMGKYDIPACIQYIRNETKRNKIVVVAHSQGATSAITKMVDDIKWWNERVEVFVSLGGVTRLDHSSSNLLKELANQRFLIDTIKSIGLFEMFPSNYLQNRVFSTICTTVPFLCDFLIELVADVDAKVNNQGRVGVFMGHYPSGSSLKSFEHFSQLMLSRKFQRFDYGEEENLNRYGDAIPPEYNLKNISGAKIIIIAGTLDRLAPIEDSQWLRDQFESNVIFYKEYELGHTSFLIAKDISFINDTIAVLKRNTLE